MGRRTASVVGRWRRSVVGLNFDFVILNLTKHSSYLVYNASLYFSSAIQKQYFNKYGQKQRGHQKVSKIAIAIVFIVWVAAAVCFFIALHRHSWLWLISVFNSAIQKQYFDKYGYGEMIPVAANDVAFSMHAVLLTAITLLQIAIYDRGNQKVSTIAIAIVCAVWLVAAVCFFIALPSHSWLWLISIFNSIQVFMTVIKYIPQAVMNFMRKSTDGFSIGNILLDFLGGIANYAQMAVQSIDQNSWVNFYGNIGKTLLSLVSVFFDLLFMFQHYILYPAEKAHISPKPNEEGAEPLVKSADGPSSENVLINWRMAEGRPGLNFSGVSATGILNHLANEDDYLDDDIDGDYDSYWENATSSSREMDEGVQIEEIADANVNDDKDNRENDDGDDDGLSFCDVGFLVDQIEGDDGWCLVEEM
ncbi:hypothetical protein GH714_041849 [Hevea brasiliensis]|uniref:Cystinosin n=1 Tax=Hevea brasiliensis TaxID=3981 RepID=A0A6A6MVT6_HEVBR|nr:hypothetical protein GH714_041849 [Hevea brasiliensis]